MRDLNQLFCDHLDFAYRVALSATREPAEAEDAVQDAYISFTTGSARYDSSRPLKPYLAQVVVNAAAMRARGERRRAAHHQTLTRESTMNEQEAGAAERSAALSAGLATLEGSQRLAVSLRYLHGLTIEETASALAVPRSTAFDLVQRGLDQLRKILIANGLGAIVVEQALAAMPQPAVPETLREAVAALAAGKHPEKAAKAQNGGFIMKIGIGVMAAVVVAVGAFWAAGGESEGTKPKAEDPKETAAPAQDAKQPAKKSAFTTPVWDPGAEWELSGRYLAPAYGTSAAWLDGPQNEILTRNNPGGWGGWSGGEERCAWSCLDEKTGQFHTVAGAGALGYLDGPFSRARHGACSYSIRMTGTESPDRRYSVLTDPFNGALRCLDYKKQEVRTLHWEGNKEMSGLTFSKAGQLYLLTPPDRLLIIDPENDRVVKTLTLEMRPNEGVKFQGWPFSLALDEKHNRLYSSGNYDPKRKWHVWYWDLEANGAFHGEAAVIDKMPASYTGKGGTGPFPVQTGSYKDGWYAYPEGSICFGPEDPDYRFLYSSRIDTTSFFRLDMEKKEIAAFSGPAKGSKTVKFINAGGTTYPFEAHVMARWLENGDFVIAVGGSKRRGLYLYKRVK